MNALRGGDRPLRSLPFFGGEGSEGSFLPVLCCAKPALMLKYQLNILFFTAIFVAVAANVGKWVKFEVKTVAGEKLQSAGIMNKPKGDGPFPAVVMLCGRAGLKDEEDAKQKNAWAERLMSWGCDNGNKVFELTINGA
jgi:hypothetical protein